MKDRLVIFDTTLRDGEQSPGAAMTRDEKLRIARQLERLRVDVIEAGFAAASPGDSGCDPGDLRCHQGFGCLLAGGGGDEAVEAVGPAALAQRAGHPQRKGQRQRQAKREGTEEGRDRQALGDDLADGAAGVVVRKAETPGSGIGEIEDVLLPERLVEVILGFNGHAHGLGDFAFLAQRPAGDRAHQNEGDGGHPPGDREDGQDRFEDIECALHGCLCDRFFFRSPERT